MKFALLIISFCTLTGCTYSANESELIEKYAQTILLGQKKIAEENLKTLIEISDDVLDNGNKTADVEVLKNAELIINTCKERNKINDSLLSSKSGYITLFNENLPTKVDLHSNNAISKLIIADISVQNELLKQKKLRLLREMVGATCLCFNNYFVLYIAPSFIVENGSIYKSDLVLSSSFGCGNGNIKINDVFSNDKSISFKNMRDARYSFKLVAKSQETKNDTVHIPAFMNVRTSYFKDTTFSTDIKHRIIRK
jgi:hypothetical protein